jgi:hypothetical protein
VVRVAGAYPVGGAGQKSGMSWCHVLHPELAGFHVPIPSNDPGGLPQGSHLLEKFHPHGFLSGRQVWRSLGPAIDVEEVDGGSSDLYSCLLPSAFGPMRALYDKCNLEVGAVRATKRSQSSGSRTFDSFASYFPNLLVC